MDPVEAGKWVGAALIAAWGLWQTRKAELSTNKANALVEKASAVSQTDANNNSHELATIYRDQLTEVRGLYTDKDLELKAYRQKHHDEVQELNATLLKLTADNGELRAKTDLAPIMVQLEGITASQERMADTQEKTSQILLQISQQLQVSQANH